MAEATDPMLAQTVVLLASAVVAVPLFRRLGLGSVLAYLAAGLAVGPFGLRFITHPDTLLHVAELGVVMFLFIIGLEMRPARLWAMRHSILGLGAAQVILCTFLLSLVAFAAGLPIAAAAVGAAGFVLSSTAVIMRMLEEKGATHTVGGERAVAILLFEDVMIVPLLALVALWAVLQSGADAEGQGAGALISVAMAGGALALLLAAGLWLLDPMFRILARTGAREVMTAAALLVVLGAAWFMQASGLSMALGAFLAGVLLSESTFRHQLEADIEPFRGILLGLFFLSVGMSFDLDVVAARWPLVLGGLLAFMATKALGIYGVARSLGSDHDEAVQRAALFAQGGEFAFVLYAAAAGVGLLDRETAAILTAIVILSMALTPLVAMALDRLTTTRAPSMDGIEPARGLRGRVLFIGFGRFAQVVSQSLLTRCVELSLIETDIDMIRAAANFGFKIHYGDGTRLDVLRASGADRVEAILVCVDRPEVADRIVELCLAEFPSARLYVRAYDRGHVLRLVEAGVDFQIRETFESALVFGQAVLKDLGYDEETVAAAIEDVRRRDEARLELQIAGGLMAGRSLMRGNMRTPEPEPLTPPRQEGRVINALDVEEEVANRG